jgi:hypothetical protein
MVLEPGSTRDMGFATSFVVTIDFIILLLIELIVCVQEIMVRGCHGGRGRGARGGVETPPVASMPEGSNPQGGEQVLRQEQIAVADIVGMMRSFQRMFEALISQSDTSEAYTSEEYVGISWLPEGIHVHCTSTIATSAADPLSRTTTPAAALPTVAVVQACSIEQTRVLGRWVVIFYFGY